MPEVITRLLRASMFACVTLALLATTGPPRGDWSATEPIELRASGESLLTANEPTRTLSFRVVTVASAGWVPIQFTG